MILDTQLRLFIKKLNNFMKSGIKKSLLVFVILSIFNSTWATSHVVPNKITNPSEKKTVLVSGTIAVNDNSVCVGGTAPIVTFTGSGGTAPYTFVYKINGGAELTVVTTTGNSVLVNQTTAVVGNFIYNLVSVKDATSTPQAVTVSDVTIAINALPTITGDLTICDNSTSQLTGSTTAATSNPWISSNNAVATVSISGLLTGISPGTSNITYTNALGCVKTVIVTVIALPSATITTNTPTTFCEENSVVLFANTGSGLTYVWKKDGDLFTPAENSSTYTATSSGSYTVTVTNSSGCSKTASISVNVNPKIEPILGPNGTYTTAVTFQNLLYFTRCTTNETGLINIKNETLNQSQVTSYTLNWGDGSPVLNLNSFPSNLTHLYNQGFYTLNISLITNQGCNYDKNYQIFVGNSPSGSLGNPGNLSGCSPKVITFPIDNTTGNTPGTQYIINFGDDQSITYTHPNVPSSITHTYNDSSCGNTPIGSSTPNSFIATMTTTNPCFPSSFATIGPILINKSPTPNFTISTSPGCINTLINVSNTSDPGSIITANGCVSSSPFYWVISPATGWTASGLGNNGGNANDTDYWSNGLNNPTINFTTTGNYSITLFIANQCDIKSITKPICIEAPLIPLFTLNKTESCAPAIITTTNITNISLSCIGNPTYLWDVQYAGGYCGGGPPIWSYTSGSATTANPSFSFVTPGTYSIKVTMANSCGAVTSAIQTVIVKKPPTVAINAIPNLCQTAGNTTISPSAVVNGCAPTTSALTYAWSFSGGIPATSNSAAPGAVNFALPGAHTVTLAVTNECGTTTDSKTFTINPLPTISGTLFACAGSTAQLTGSATASTTAPWTSSNTAIATVSSTGLVTAIAAGTTTITYTNNNDCQKTALFTVNPLGQVTLPVSQVVCNGSSTAAITFATTNTLGSTAYTWTNNNINTGLAASGPGNIPAFSTTNNGTTPITSIITVTPTLTNGSVNCPGSSVNFSITVNPTAQVNQPTNTVFCAGTATAAIPFLTANTGGTTTYNWSIDNTNLGLAASGSGSIPVFTPINNSTTPITATITVTPSFSNGSTACTGTPKTFTITVNPKGQVNPIASQIICNGSNTTAVAFNTNNTIGTTTYSWTNTNSSIGLPSSGTGNIPTFVGTNTTNSPTVGDFVVTPTFTTGTISCTGPTQTFSITVNPAPQVNAISNVVVCHTASTTAINFSTSNTGPGTVSYNWTNDNPSIGLAASGSGNIAGFTATNAGTTPVIATITVTPFYLNGTVTCTGTAKTFTITVNPKGQVNPIANQTVCNGQPVTAINFDTTNTGGTTTYNWTNNLSGIGLAGSGSGNIAAFNAVNNTTVPITATIVVTPTFTNGTSTCLGLQQSFTIVVNPTPSATLSGAASVCVNATNPQLIFAGSSGMAPYTFTYTINGGTPLTVTTIAGNSIIVSAPTGITGNYIYNLTGIQDASTPFCTKTLNISQTISVVALPTIATQPLTSQTICVGGTIAPLTVAHVDGLGTATYKWYTNTNATNTGGTVIAGATSASYTPPAYATAGTFYYYAVVTLSGTGCGVATSLPATVIVVADPIVSAQPLTTQTQCQSNTATQLSVTATGGTGTFTYQWYSNTLNNNTTGTAIATATNNTYTPPTATVATVYYYCMIGQSGLGCNVTSTTAAVIVVPAPTINLQPQPSTVCQNGTPTTLSVTYINGTGTATYQWYSNVNNDTTTGTAIPAAIASSYVPPTNTVGTLYYYCIVTLSSGGCTSVISDTSKVTINANPLVTTAQTQTACSNSLFSIAPSDGNGNIVPTGITYSWSAPTVTGGMTGGANGSNQPTINGILNNPTNIAQTATYSVTPTANGCSGTAFSVVVTVNPKPVIANVSPAAICSGTAFTVTPTNGGATIIPIGTTFTWIVSINNTNITGQSDSSAAGITMISQTLTNTSPTAQTLTYTVTPTSGAAGNCVGATFTIVVTVNPAIVASGIVTQVTISGLSNGAVDVSASGGSGSYTYSWSGPNGFSAVTQDISSVTAGTYILTINDGVCPPKILTFNITSPLPLIIQENIADHINELCNGAATASVTIEITQGSIGPYDYSIALQSGGSAGSALAINALSYSFTGLAAGTYTATVTDANGSIKTITGIIITEPTIIVTAISAQTNVNCNGNNTGSATVFASGGTPGTVGTGYTYSWNTTPIQISATATGLTQGTFTVTIKDANLCEVQQQVLITEPTAIVSSITAKTDVLCYGNATGAATVFASGGTPGTATTGYTYSWNTNPIQTTATAINLAAGTYTVTIKDDLLCTKTQQVTILEPNAALSSVISNSTNVSCFGGSNGTATVSASNGTAPYTYSWNTNPIQTSATATGLAQGTYIVTTTDTNLCTSTSTVNITEPVALSGAITAQTNVLCSGNSTGAATVTPIGGTAPFTYSWNTLPIQTSATAVGLPIGTYTVIITDFKGCTTTVDAIITEPNGIVTAIASQTNVDCFGNSTGAATISASGGNGLLTYSWSPNSNTSVSATGLSAGNYNVTVTDANGCSKVQPIVITQPIAPLTTLFASFNDISCYGGNDGTITVTTSGGTAPYTYSWNTSPIQTTSTASNLTIGTYTLTVTDANLCTSQITKTLVEPNELLITLNSITPIICYGSTTGAIEVSISQASVANYNYAISGTNYLGATYFESQTQTGLNYTFTGLLAGTYTITITDANGCSKQMSNNLVTQPLSALGIINPIISDYNGFSSSCFGANNGSINIQTQGGYLPYVFQWNGPSGFTAATEDISGLAPGVYNLTISDNGGCSIPFTYIITEPSEIIIITDLEKDITCFNDADGAILLTIIGGTSTYTYSWTKDGSPFASTQDISNLAPGTYTVTVSDNNSCGPKTQSYTITQPPILAITLVNQTNILCYGQNTGAISVNVVGGTPLLIAPGIFGYQYTWTGPNGFASNLQNLTALFAGSYQLKVTDNSGCFKELTVVLTQPNDVIISYTTTPISCYGANDASITLTIVGGVAPYDIIWSNLGHGLFQDNLAAGDYSIIVTDSNACVKTIVVPIPEAPIFTIYPVVTNISCFGANNGSVILNIVGGVAPVSLLWSDNPSAGNQRNNLGPGTYTVTISDGKPCYINRTFTILEPQELILSANVTNAFDCNDANSGNINLLVAGGTAPFSYNWSNGATTEDLTTISAGNYLVTVTDANGCFKTAQYSINRQPPIVIAVDTDIDFDCDTKYVKQTFVAQVSGGVPPYQLAWSSGLVSGANNEFMNTNQNGTVILTVTDSFGCIQSYSFNVAIPTLGDAGFSSTSYAYQTYGNYSMQDPIQFTNTATGDFVSVAWDFGDGSVSNDLNPIHTYAREGNYIVTQTVTYPFGCISVSVTTLVIEKGYELIIPTAFTPNDDTINDYFTPVSIGLQSIELNVYDTWGELIYSEKGTTIKGWNGKIKNVHAENGNYYYKVIAKTFYGEIINRNGPFTLIK